MVEFGIEWNAGGRVDAVYGGDVERNTESASVGGG